MSYGKTIKLYLKRMNKRRVKYQTPAAKTMPEEKDENASESDSRGQKAVNSQENRLQLDSNVDWFKMAHSQRRTVGKSPSLPNQASFLSVKCSSDKSACLRSVFTEKM